KAKTGKRPWAVVRSGQGPSSAGPSRGGAACRGLQVARREHVAGSYGQEELHPVPRRRKVPPGELLDLAHPISKGVSVDQQLLGRRLPPGVALQEGAQGRDQLASMVLVVSV